MTPFEPFDEHIARLERTNTMSAANAISQVSTTDPAQAHEEVEKILLAYVHPDVETAVEDLIARCDWWGFAP